MCFDRRHVCERTLARSPPCVSTGTVAMGVFKKGCGWMVVRGRHVKWSRQLYQLYQAAAEKV